MSGYYHPLPEQAEQRHAATIADLTTAIRALDRHQHDPRIRAALEDLRQARAELATPPAPLTRDEQFLEACGRG